MKKLWLVSMYTDIKNNSQKTFVVCGDRVSAVRQLERIGRIAPDFRPDVAKFLEEQSDSVSAFAGEGDDWKKAAGRETNFGWIEAVESAL